jgi:hypothetical protein
MAIEISQDTRACAKLQIEGYTRASTANLDGQSAPWLPLRTALHAKAPKQWHGQAPTQATAFLRSSLLT